MRTNPALAPAWSAWQSGAFASARTLSDEVVAAVGTRDAGHHILALVAHVTGDHIAAIAQRHRIRPDYRWLRQLDEPILWSYVHEADLEAALRFAEVRRMPRSTLKRLDLALRRPLSVELDGAASLPFTDDPLSPYMPGIAANLCGRSTIADPLLRRLRARRLQHRAGAGCHAGPALHAGSMGRTGNKP